MFENILTQIGAGITAIIMAITGLFSPAPPQEPTQPSSLIIEMEQGSVLPTTEGAADTTNYSVPSGSTAIIDGLTQKTHFCKSYSPVTLRYGRFKISTKTGNTADVTLNAWLSKLEDD